ncbi:MAG TPA: hypothetical protein VHW74_16405 [Mycobacteriales bacterium]|nr:hypothetical protein [Mycobacteriales bacterium]
MPDAVEPILAGRSSGRAGLWARRVAMCVLAAVMIAALCNVFGQRATTVHATGPLARIDVRAPATVRPGLLFQAKITLSVSAVLPKAQLILSRGWIDGLTLNTEEPAAPSETSGPDGSLVLSIGTLQPGSPYVQYLAYQVNPTSLSRRAQAITLVSDGVAIVTLHRTMTIVP